MRVDIKTPDTNARHETVKIESDKPIVTIVVKATADTPDVAVLVNGRWLTNRVDS